MNATKLQSTKKITLATVKSFIKANKETLFIKCSSSFCGMEDMTVYNSKAGFKIAKGTESNQSNTLGVDGAWFVGSSRDRFDLFVSSEMIGIEVYNCCGSFTLSILK